MLPILTVSFGRIFDSRVRTLFRQGHTDKKISETLHVNPATVNRRTNIGASRGAGAPELCAFSGLRRN
jgi:hypothetical protein